MARIIDFNLSGYILDDSTEHTYQVVHASKLGVFGIKTSGIPPTLVFDYSLTCWGYLSMHTCEINPDTLADLVISRDLFSPDVIARAKVSLQKKFDVTVEAVEGNKIRITSTPQ